MNSKRTLNSTKNIVVGVTNQIVMLILGFISRNVFISVLGLEYLGMNGIFSDVLGMLSLVDLGFGTAMVYSFYKPIADKDTNKISALITFYGRIYNYIAGAVTIIGIGLIPFLKQIINTEISYDQLVIYYIFSLSNVIITYLFVYKTCIISASQMSYIVTSITMLFSFLKTVVQIILLLVFENYVAYITINVVFSFLINYYSSKKAEKIFPYIKQKGVLSKEEKQAVFKNLRSIFIYKFSSVLLVATDNIFISNLVSTIAVGLYSNYLMLENKISAFVKIFFTSLTASIGNLIFTENASKRYAIFCAMQSISFILCGTVTISYGCLVNDVIKIWLGEQYLFSKDIVVMIVLNMYLSFVLQPLWSYREATGLYRKTKYVMLITAATNIILSVLLGRLWGVAGILAASVIARVSTYFWYEPYLLFNLYFERSVWKYYKSMGLHFILTFVSLGGFYQLFKLWQVTTWLSLFVKMIICGGTTTLYYVLLYRKEEGSKIIIQKFMHYVIWAKRKLQNAS